MSCSKVICNALKGDIFVHYSHVNSTTSTLKGTCMRFYILVQIIDELDDLSFETSNTEESEKQISSKEGSALVKHNLIENLSRKN